MSHASVREQAAAPLSVSAAASSRRASGPGTKPFSTQQPGKKLGYSSQPTEMTNQPQPSQSQASAPASRLMSRLGSASHLPNTQETSNSIANLVSEAYPYPPTEPLTPAAFMDVPRVSHFQTTYCTAYSKSSKSKSSNTANGMQTPALASGAQTPVRRLGAQTPSKAPQRDLIPAQPKTAHSTRPATRNEAPRHSKGGGYSRASTRPASPHGNGPARGHSQTMRVAASAEPISSAVLNVSHTSYAAVAAPAPSVGSVPRAMAMKPYQAMATPTGQAGQHQQQNIGNIQQQQVMYVPAQYANGQFASGAAPFANGGAYVQVNGGSGGQFAGVAGQQFTFTPYFYGPPAPGTSTTKQA